MTGKAIGRPLGLLTLFAAAAALLFMPALATADVVGIGDIFPFIDNPDTEEVGDFIPDLPQFGNDGEDPVLAPIPVLVVGGTNNLIGGTATGQLTIDIPADTFPLEVVNGYIGGNIFGLGQVRVLGLNSELQATNSFTVGYEGQGFLDVVAGARLQVLRFENPVTDPDDEVQDYDLVLGAWEGSQGFTEIDGFASLVLSGNLSVGHRGQGRIDMLNGARMITTNEASVGTAFDIDTNENAIGTGYVLVDGPGTRWNVGIVPSSAPPLPTGGTAPTEDDLDGLLTIGRQGRGTVEVRNKGWVRVETDTLLGEQDGSFGKAVVSGADSLLWTLENMFVGNSAGTAAGELHIDDQGEARADGDGSGGVTVGARGLVELGGGTLITPNVLTDGVIRGDGRIESPNVVSSGDIRNAAGLANIREKLLFTGEITNTGNIESIGGEMEFQGVVNHTGADADLVGINAIFRFQEGLNNSGGGRIFLEDSLIYVPVGSSLSSASSLSLWAGESTLVGDLELQSGNRLNVTLGNNEYGRLEMTGDASLAGLVNVSLESDYLPQIGDAFEIIDADNVAGTFSGVIGGGTGAGFWQASYTGTSAILSYVADIISTLASDFDGNGVVDAGDLAIWRANFGKSPALRSDGDANGDGVVDAADLMIWQGELGDVAPTVVVSTPAANPAAGAIPEPSSFALAALAVAGLAGFRKRS